MKLQQHFLHYHRFNRWTPQQPFSFIYTLQCKVIWDRLCFSDLCTYVGVLEGGGGGGPSVPVDAHVKALRASLSFCPTVGDQYQQTGTPTVSLASGWRFFASWFTCSYHC